MSKEPTVNEGNSLVRRQPHVSNGVRTAVRWGAAPGGVAAALLATPVVSQALSTAPHVLGSAAEIGGSLGLTAVAVSEAVAWSRSDGPAKGWGASVAGMAGIAGVTASIAATGHGDAGSILGPSLPAGIIGGGIVMGVIIAVRHDNRSSSVPADVRAHRLSVLTRIAAPVGTVAAAADLVQHVGGAHVMAAPTLGAVAVGGLATAAATGAAAWRMRVRAGLAD